MKSTKRAGSTHRGKSFTFDLEPNSIYGDCVEAIDNQYELCNIRISRLADYKSAL